MSENTGSGYPTAQGSTTRHSRRLAAGGGPESTSEITGLLNSDDSRLEFVAPSPHYKIILKIIFTWKAANCPLSGTRDRTTTAQHNTSHSLLPDSFGQQTKQWYCFVIKSPHLLWQRKESSPLKKCHLFKHLHKALSVVVRSRDNNVF